MRATPIVSAWVLRVSTLPRIGAPTRTSAPPGSLSTPRRDGFGWPDRGCSMPSAVSPYTVIAPRLARRTRGDEKPLRRADSPPRRGSSEEVGHVPPDAGRAAEIQISRDRRDGQPGQWRAPGHEVIAEQQEQAMRLQHGLVVTQQILADVVVADVVPDAVPDGQTYRVAVEDDHRRAAVAEAADEQLLSGK